MNRDLATYQGLEHFVTPEWIVEAALARIPASPMPRTIVDAGAGTGVWGKVARHRWPIAHLMGVEIDPAFDQTSGYDAWAWDDFLCEGNPLQFIPIDLVMSNPPFSLAEEFIRQALQLAHPDGGRVVMLLRQAYLNGIERGNTLWTDTPLEHVSMLSRRPSFTGNGKTDTKTEYALFYWRNGYVGAPTLGWVRGQKTRRTRQLALESAA